MSAQQPLLRWKPNALRHEKDLKSATASTPFTTMNEALNAIDGRKKNNVILLTRTTLGWTISEYIGPSVCKVNFKELRLGGLPLGGDPLAPQTYIVDGK